MAENVIQFDYVPRKEFVGFHERAQRWTCMVFHRRAGKTVATINDVVAKAVYTQKKNAKYAYIAPFYRQAKEVAWLYLKEATKDVAVKVRESELSVEIFNGSKISLYGADNPDALRGIYLDGVVLDEYGDCRPSLWAEVVLPTLADRKGWAIFIGTPKGKNHFYDIWRQATIEDPQRWYSSMGRADETGIIDEEELEQMRAQMSDDQYAQEFLCSFDAAVKGTYYAHILEEIEQRGQVNELVTWDPEYKVNVAADLGFRDDTTFWYWQWTDKGLNIIDYDAYNGKHVDFYVGLLNDKPYEYDTVWLPHDAKAKTLATKRSTVEQFQDAEFPVKVAPKLGVQHGIDAGRMVLKVANFSQELCSEGLEGLRAYRRKYDEVKKIFQEKPEHTWASHPADAWRLLSLVAKPRILEINKFKTREPILKNPEWRLDELFEDNESGRRKFNAEHIN